MKLLLETQKFIHDLELEKKDDSAFNATELEDDFLLDNEEDELTVGTRQSGTNMSSDLELRRAIKFNKRRLITAKKTADKVIQLQTYFNLGTAFHSLGYSDKSMKSFNKALELAKQLDEKTYYVKIYCSLGNLYRDQRDMNRAFQYYESALEISKEIGDKELQAQVLAALER
jgi:tetratricopeptide (TPR) repeat protein